LKAILGILPVSDQALTNPPNHRPVSTQQGGKSRLVSARNKPFQELFVGRAGQGIGAKGASEMIKERVAFCPDHQAFPKTLPLNTVAYGAVAYKILSE
jgi:hypothetical protein